MTSPAGRLRRRLFTWVDRIPTMLFVALVASLLFLVYAVVAGEFADVSVARHLFYVPIVLAAARLGVAAGAATGAIAMVLAGPLVGAAEVEVWGLLGLQYLLVGVVVGLLATARADGLVRERDVAERERALVAQRAALVQLVSHEFRTPLTVIHGSVETLRQRDGAVAAPFRGLVEATGRSVDRLEEMVDVVLAAADELDVDAARQSAVEVRDLVRHAAVSLRPGLPERLDVHVPAHAVVTTVEPYLWLTLRCLLDNAVKYSPPEEPIEVLYEHGEDTVVISVRDHGPGLPAGFEQFAFEPFSQGDPTERRSPGLGMGLYTARRLIRRLGGDVTVSSGDGSGVTAHVFLPQRRHEDVEGKPRSSAVRGEATSAAHAS